ncbi:flagellar M-ring protein [Acrasis kona]|uniref:Flagellar M-ring protein n=1 Tax=Acrasis kona TaxID=1008807 RepID=A0AAW2YV23_9EUKA
MFPLAETIEDKSKSPKIIVFCLSAFVATLSILCYITTLSHELYTLLPLDMYFGLSKDDLGRLLNEYTKEGRFYYVCCALFELFVYIPCYTSNVITANALYRQSGLPKKLWYSLPIASLLDYVETLLLLYAAWTFDNNPANAIKLSNNASYFLFHIQKVKWCVGYFFILTVVVSLCVIAIHNLNCVRFTSNKSKSH